jgi:hypothetical protein
MPYSRTRAIAKALVTIVLCCAFGGWLLWMGASGLIEGQVMIHPKRAPAYTAYPSGATAAAFHFKVWGGIAVGTCVFALGVALGALLAFGSDMRRDEALRRLATHRLQRPGPTVPGWAAALVIVGLLLFLFYVARRWHMPVW